MTLHTGDLLQERYRIVSSLGQGGMGAVYRAWHLNLHIPVAIKEMIPQPNLEAQTLTQLRRQFQQEAAILAHLHHPHLVGVRDFFEEDGNAYLVMHFIEGESLAAIVERDGALTEDQALIWAGQLLDALAYCHNQGVIHRDVKPQNVIICSNGQAVLVDFGLVKLWDPHDPHTKTVIRGMGTPEYAPPEQYDVTASHTDPRSDIYSLGATLYHSLTGQAPPSATQRMANPSSLRVPRSLNPRLSTRTEQAILQAMEPQPERRFQRAHDMAAALSDRASTTVTRSAGATHRATKVMPGKRDTVSSRPAWVSAWVWGLGGACLLALATGVFVLVMKKGDSPPSPATAALPTETPITALPTEPPPAPTMSSTATFLPPSLGDTWLRPGDGAMMVYVPAGEFEMGNDDDGVEDAFQMCMRYRGHCEREWFEDEQPVHTVALDGFWMDRTEVTNAQYQQCVESGACGPPAERGSHTRDSYYGDSAYDNHPVINVSWYQARSYCDWVGARLPTEAEWEYTARGPDGRMFPWGNEFGARLNYCDANCVLDWADEAIDDGYVDTAPVGSFPRGASWCGVLDIAGNVWEWSADWYDDSYYARSTHRNPAGTSSGEYRILRGSSWYSNRSYTRSTYRYSNTPDYFDVDVGFRCVISLGERPQ